MKTIELPNGESYQLQYDATYGLISKIIYPTGAWVQYTWNPIPNAEGIQYRAVPGAATGGLCAIIHDWFAITKRVVSYDGTHSAEEQDFAYATTWPAAGQSNSYQWTSKTTTVTTKDLLRGTSFNTVYTYSPMLPPAESSPLAAWEQLGVVPQESTIAYSDTNGSLLKTVTKTWQSISLMSGECETLPNGQTSGKFYAYQPYNPIGFAPLNPEASWTDLPTDVSEYDYGAVSSNCAKPSSTPTRETKTVYASFANTPLFPFPSILDRPCIVQIYGNGSLFSETDYGYDGASATSCAGGSAAPTYVSAYGHDDANYGSGSTASRGNPTTVTRKCFVGSTNCTNSVTTFTYDTTGQVLSMTDACGNGTCSDMSGSSHTTTYAYTDSYTNGAPSSSTNAYVTKITNSLGQTTKFQWGFEDGKMWQKTDENNRITNFCYTTGGCGGSGFDPFYRLTGANYPDTGQEKVTYSDAGPNPSVTTSTLLTSSWLTKETIYDAIGHPITSEITSDPSGTDYTQTTYDGLGRIWTVTNPYRTTSDPSYGVTTHYYDALDRPTAQAQPDGNFLEWCYNGVVSTLPTGAANICSGHLGSVTTGTWADSSDETGRKWQRTSDGLGRLVAVMEPNSSNVPAQETDYQYDVLGNLFRVDQWGAAYGHNGDRVRTFTYDSLSRLLCASNPENSTASCPNQATTSYTPGTVGYAYDLNGNLKSRTDARGITTTHSYDALNRLTGKQYSDGTQAVAFGYDGKDQNGNPISGLSNAIGRLSKSTNNVNAASIYSYDLMGRITSKFVCVPGNCSYSMGATATYDLAGDLTNSHLATGLAIGMTYDSAARFNSVTIPTNNPSSTLWSNPTYGPVGLTRATLGNGLLEEIAYDNRNRITAYAVGQAANSTPGGSPPFGNVDSAVNAESGGSSVPVGGFVKVGGWAASNQDGSPLAQIVVLLDGKPLGSATLGASRPDVASYYNQPSFTNSGWNFIGSIGNVATGTHTITAVAYDWNQNSAAVATAIQITVTSDSAPVGNVDTVTGATSGTTTVTSGGLITVSGWAADNEDGSPVAKVVVLLDGQPIGDATLGISRPDVASLYNNPAWGRSGWSLTGSIFGATTGTHTITAAAYDSSGNQAVLNSSTISVVANSNSYTGNLDSVANATNSGSNSITMGGNITAAGWAAEPDQNPGAPLSRVEIDIDGQYLGLATLGISRSDVVSTTGRSDYLSSGFSFTGPVSNVDPGEHEIEARVYTHSGGSYILGSSNIVVGGSMPALSGTVVPARYSYSVNYAPNGNVMNAGDSVNGNWSYNYDNLNRLASAMSSTTGLTMTYDAFGNRWQQTVTAGTAPQFDITFNTATNHMDGFCYDAAGNVLDDGPCVSPHKYSYDAEGRLISGNYGATTYLYDADGFRVAKQSSGSTTDVYFYDVAGRVGVVTDGSFNVLRTEIYADNRHLATYQGSNIFYTHTNWLGTEAARSDKSGNLCETISNLPFGDAQQTSGTCSPTPTFFTGQERDAESGNDYFGARFYASSMGRFFSPDWSKDPDPLPWADIENPQTLNLYTYVRNNPLSFKDPDGHRCGETTSRTNANGDMQVFGNCDNDDFGTWLQLAGAVGHHFIPRELFKNLNPSTFQYRVMDKFTSGKLRFPKVNRFDRLHRAYNKEMRRLIERYEQRSGRALEDFQEGDFKAIAEEMQKAGGDTEAFLTRLSDANPDARSIIEGLQDALESLRSSDAGQAIEGAVEGVAEACESGACL